MYSGRGSYPAKGFCGVFSTELNTRNTFERGYGLMFDPDPCIKLQSNHNASPG